MRFNQILSAKENELLEAQTASLLKSKPQTANFGGQPSGYSGTTTTVNPTKLPAKQQAQAVPTATSVKGAYSAAGTTAPGQTPQAPGAIPNKVAPQALAQAPTVTTPATTPAAGQVTAAPNQPAAPQTGSKLGGMLKGAGNLAAGAVRGAGNIASQAAGGVTQTLGAAGGGLVRGFQGAKAGSNFSATAPSSSMGATRSAAVGDAELADLRARLDSIENLIKSKP
jgi:hypothetical protein